MYNPQAGEKSLPVDGLVSALEKRGAKVITQSTKADGYAKALEKVCDFILIAGGDGTIEKVAKLIVHNPVPIAILPFGNANNIAASLNVEMALDEIINNWKKRNFSKFSVGSILINGEKEYFLESVGWGLFSEVLSKSKEEKNKITASAKVEDKVESGLTLLNEEINELQPAFYEIQLDGMDYSGSYLWVEIMNTQSMGPQLKMAPEARHGDEFLDVVLIKEEDREKLKFFLNENRKSNGNGFRILKAKNIKTFSFESIHIDDEIYKPKKFDPSDQAWLEISLVPQFFWIINASW
jgi:diacylglycerol kinase family enzyme